MRCGSDIRKRCVATEHDGKDQKWVSPDNDGLSTDDKVSMIYLFMNNAAAADTYLSLNDSNIRRAWVMRMLAEGEAAM